MARPKKRKEDLGASADADRVLSPSATEPVPVSAHSGDAPLRASGRQLWREFRMLMCLGGAIYAIAIGRIDIAGCAFGLAAYIRAGRVQ